MRERLLADPHRLAIIYRRLAWQLTERHRPFDQTILVGIQANGVFLMRRLHHLITTEILPRAAVEVGELDITFYRDDYRRGKTLVPSRTHMPASVENKHVVLIDDVLYTGRTIRAALDALLDFGRPASVALLCLVDRKFSRQFPLEPTYSGLRVDTRHHQHVKVCWQEKDDTDRVLLIDASS